MYRELEAKVLADEAIRKDKERERRVSMGLPAEEGAFSPPRTQKTLETIFVEPFSWNQFLFNLSNGFTYLSLMGLVSICALTDFTGWWGSREAE